MKKRDSVTVTWAKRLAATALAVLLAFAALPVSAASAGDAVSPGGVDLSPVKNENLITLLPGVYAANNEIMLQLRPGADAGAIARIAKKYRASVTGSVDAVHTVQLRFGTSFTAAELLSLADRISGEAAVVSARPHYFFETMGTGANYNVNVGNEWRADLQNATDRQGKSWAVEALNAPAAWSFFDTVKKDIYPIKVGVVDTGFATWHEDLDFLDVYNLQSNTFEGCYVHGTSVAGCFAATGNNATGIVGVYPYGSKNLLGFSAERYYRETQVSDVYVDCAGIGWLLERGARVINVSRAYGVFNQIYYYSYVNYNAQMLGAYYRMMDEIADTFGAYVQSYLDCGYDFVLVAAAGNYSNSNYFQAINAAGETVTLNMRGYMPAEYTCCLTAVKREAYPDVYDRIIVVGAMSPSGSVSEFSCTGSRVDLYAPGEDVYTTTSGESFSGTGYGSTGGTSVSAPLIAGVAADVLTMDPWLRGDEVKRIICYIAGPYKGSSSLPNNPDTLQAVYLANEVRDELVLGVPNSYGLKFPPRHGDVDRDGKVTTADARKVLRIALDLEAVSRYSIPFRQADMDNNGSISVAEARSILRIAVNLDPLPITY